jgi:hypothetical protein
MEIQDGEGPTAPPVLGPVFLGQTLSLVFTLGDDVFNFDSNVLSCWATDGWFLHLSRIIERNFNFFFCSRSNDSTSGSLRRS